MNNISNYYGKFISKLTVKDVIKTVENSDTDSTQESDVLNANLKQVYKAKTENDTPTQQNKRNIKAKMKEQHNNFDKFCGSIEHAKYKTQIDYSQIINDFVQFSPESKIEDYFDYLKFKSGASPSITIDEFIVTGSLVKRANIIKRYLFFLHHKVVPSLKFKYFKRPKSKPTCQIPRISRAKLLEYYHDLASNGKFEDAVMLHASYSLMLEPYQLYLLSFKSLKEDKTIDMWDHKTRQLTTLNLTDNLYNELVFLRKYKELKSQQIKDETRTSLDGTNIEGPFIFKTSPSGIYNKFSRKFGGLLKDFNITPKDIVILAKQERKNSNSRLYPIWI